MTEITENDIELWAIEELKSLGWNYIHPYAQWLSKFNPDLHTAKICWQVLQAALHDLIENRSL